MFKRNEIVKVRKIEGLSSRPRRARIIDVVGDDAMVELSDRVAIVDVGELLPILEGRTNKATKRKNFSSRTGRVRHG